MKVLAQIEDGKMFLVSLGQMDGRELGCLVNTNTGTVSGRRLLGSIVNFTHGYWTHFVGDPAPVLALAARGKSPRQGWRQGN